MNVKAGFSGTTRLATEPVNEGPVPSNVGDLRTVHKEVYWCTIRTAVAGR